MPPTRVLVIGPSDVLLPPCLELRRQVFSGEQGVPEAVESDGRDGECVHFVAVADDETVLGTARMRSMPGCVAKAERVAVRSRMRGRGVGRALMLRLETEAAAKGHTAVLLGAQAAVVGFYARLGYVARGPRYEEAGIEHQLMERRLPTGSDGGEGLVEG